MSRHDEITCLDYSADMMAHAEKRAKAMDISHISPHKGDVGALSFEDESFDIVLSLHGFHAFPDNMIKTTLKIDGMMCSICEAHICEVIRKAVPTAKKVAASRGKKEASFLTEGAVDAESLKTAIDATGYSCLSVESAPYEKKEFTSVSSKSYMRGYREKTKTSACSTSS